MNNQVFQYNGQPVTFQLGNGEIMANATEMAKPFGKRPWILVEVKDAEMVILQDEEGNDIVYEHEGKEYNAAEVCYSLGDIIDKSSY